MRFIGNKEPIVNDIKSLLQKEGLINTKKRLKLFDAFAGTGAVSDFLKDSFDLIVNDILSWCVIYTRGRVSAEYCDFKKLGYDPFEFLNSNKIINKGFFYKNYSPGGSNRKYFSKTNAGRIDYFRQTIESWKQQELIDSNEYSFLLASLIESISYVSNTAGVYGAFLKHWDPRSNKSLVFRKVQSKNSKHNKIRYLNKKIEDVINDVECDVLYLDPPYTQNQYGTQYHILETLVLNDSPSLSRITGSRPVTPMRSDWSVMYKAHILFDKVVANTKAKYIVFSYSADGLMSKSFIETNLKRYGKVKTYKVQRISYNKYTNFKSKGVADHFEYLFFIEKKNKKEVYFESPLNFIGSKAKTISKINDHFPNKSRTFYDIFGGGFNVGINSKAEHIIYNDINYFVTDLVKSFKLIDTYDYLLFINKIVRKFKLQKADEKSYLSARAYYNSFSFDKRDSRILFAVLLYGYNQQIRFNGNHDFNNPVGMRWFNDKVLEKMISFSRAIKEKNVSFSSLDFATFISKVNKNSFVYLDPPYRHTTGSYNDGKRGFNGWDQKEEARLFEFADSLNNKSVRFMISHVLEHKGKINLEFTEWIRQKGYHVIKVEKYSSVPRNEVLVVNYKI